MQEQENNGRDSKGKFAKGNNLQPRAAQNAEIWALRHRNYSLFLDVCVKESGSIEAELRKIYLGLHANQKYETLLKMIAKDPAAYDKTKDVEDVVSGLSFDTPEKYEQALQILEKTQRELNELSKS